MTTVVLVLLASYLVGAIPWSWLVVRAARGTDLRQVGSGNLGATNTFRALGTPAALLVLVLDVLKGWIAPAVFARLRLGTPAVPDETLAVLAGAAAIVGHIFPVYVGFRGGKGIATTAGVFLALAPRALLIALGVFLAGVVATRGIVSVGSLLAAIALPVAVRLAAPRANGGPLFAATVLLALLIVFKHRENLVRLARGRERRFFDRSGRGPREAEL